MSADAQIYNDATFTIDGVPFATGMVTASRAKMDAPMQPADAFAIPSGSFATSGTMEVSGDAFDSLIALMQPRERSERPTRRWRDERATADARGVQLFVGCGPRASSGSCW